MAEGRLLDKVEALKRVMVARATNGKYDDYEYSTLRRELKTVAHIAPFLPNCVHSNSTLEEFWGFIQPEFPKYAERRLFLKEAFEPLIFKLEAESTSSGDATITDSLQSISPEYIQEQWQKALERRNSDPEGAITISRTLLESVCKYILETNVPIKESTELPAMYKMTAKALNLSPSQHTEEVFKQILGGCQSVVEGLGALRNKHSDAHGKSAKSVKPAPRHAELAVNLSGAMASFLLQTHLHVSKTNQVEGKTHR